MNTIRSILFTGFIFLTFICFSQPYFKRYDSVPVIINSTYISNAWAGGLNFVQTSSIDLNQDGIKDLFIFDRSGNKIRTFINKGTPNTVDYIYDASYETKFPKLQEWALLADYNCDGKEDIFSYSKAGGGFDVYKNISSLATGVQFQLVSVLQKSMYNPPNTGPTSVTNLYVSSVDIPAISDIDNDGDLDIVTFAITGTYMEYHINMSMELYGTCDSLKFQMKNRCWGYAAEDPSNNTYYLHDTCGGNVSNPGIIEQTFEERSAERHSGSCQLCIDLDNDGDKEFIVGDVSFSNLTMLTNGGTPTSGNMVAVDTAFPSHNSNTNSVALTLFPCAYYVDVDNDGKKDLIVSPNAPNASENFNSEVFYKNNGTNSFPVFQYQQSNLLQDNMIEVGEGAYPVFFDYDNDGLKDLFVGNNGYYNPSAFENKIAQFHNIGTPTSPKFELITRDYSNLSSLGIKNMVPTFGDMDGDGDSDMIIGADDGALHYFRNTAPIGGTANFVLAAVNFKNSNNRKIDVGTFAAPQIVDVDNDGKNDIVIGSAGGKFAYYHHIGSGTSTIPVVDSVSHFWGKIKVNQPFYFFGYSYPFVFKQGGVTKLLSGSELGYLRLYDNIDGNLNGSFALVDSTYLNIREGGRTALCGADITSDGYLDFVIGNYSGGVSFFKGVSSITGINEIDNYINWNMEAYPNPANNTITINIINEKNSFYKIELMNGMGQTVSSENTSNTTVTYNTENLKPGIYICKVAELQSNGIVKQGVLTKKIVIQH